MLFKIDPKLVPFIDTNAESQGVAKIITADATSVTLSLGENVQAKVSLVDALADKSVTKANLREFVRGGKIYFNGNEAVRFEAASAPVSTAPPRKSGSAVMIGNN